MQDQGTTTPCCHPNLVSLLFCCSAILIITTSYYTLLLVSITWSWTKWSDPVQLPPSAAPVMVSRSNWWPLLVLLLKFILFWSTREAAAGWTLNPPLMNSLFWHVDILWWTLKLLLNTKTLLKHYKFIFRLVDQLTLKFYACAVLTVTCLWLR